LSNCWLDWECKIFNRWGDVVWWSLDPSDRWLGGNEVSYVPDGVYVWMIRGRTFSSTKVVSLQGHVTVIR